VRRVSVPVLVSTQATRSRAQLRLRLGVAFARLSLELGLGRAGKELLPAGVGFCVSPVSPA
jgi:hypothetical protein